LTLYSSPLGNPISLKNGKWRVDPSFFLSKMENGELTLHFSFDPSFFLLFLNVKPPF
jgi:hypothetical protein